MANVEYGLQMYSVRDITGKDLKDALKQVAEMGYRYVEFAGLFGNRPEEVKAWLDTYGLICSGVHIGRAHLEDDVLPQTIAEHKTLGCSNLIISGMDWSTLEKLDDNIALINRVQKTLAEHGFTLGYHNHSHEFLPTPYGKIVEDEIINRTGAELQIDTWWAYNAGLDPVALCEKLKDRIRVIHLKDGIAVAPESRTFEHCHDNAIGKSVGAGEGPVLAVREWCLKNNVLMVIESEGLDPTGPEEVKRCIEFLRTLDC